MKASMYRLSFLMILLASCSEDFIDLKQQGKLTDQNFFDNEENAIMYVNSCYDAISWDEGIYLGLEQSSHNYEFMFGDWVSDDAKSGEPNPIELEEWRLQAGRDYFGKSLWMSRFKGLFRMNMALLRLPDALIEQDLKNQLLGEVFFLRAYTYFYLVRVFGGVPLFTEPVKPSEYKSTKRASISEVYKLIEADLKQAVSLLPEKSQYPPADLGRATKGAAKAYMARAIMYQLGMDNSNQHTWQEVFNLCDEIVKSGEYNLVPNYATIFEMEGENNSESIFEIQFADNTMVWGTAKAGTTATVYQGNSTMAYNPIYRENNSGEFLGWGYTTPTQDLEDSFEPGDPRLPCTIINDKDIVNGIRVYVDLQFSAQTGHYSRKAHMDPEFAPVIVQSSPINERKFRYADVLLIQAEAAYYIKNEALARQRVNEIRARARQSTKPKGSIEGNGRIYLPYDAAEQPANLLADITSSGQQLLEEIWKERRHELALESLRFWDLVRTGRYLDAAETRYSYNPKVIDYILSHCIPAGGNVINPIPLFPIPLVDIVSFGLEQNPGY